jgi:hypothetical protein
MISQNFDHPAIGDAAVRAFFRHALHLGAQRPKPADAAVNLEEMRAGNLIGCGA